MELVMKFV